MNILITGVHGFVGTNLVKHLAPYHTIYGLDIVTPDKEGVNKTFTWDILDKTESFPKIDAVIHLAGIVYDTRSTKAADLYYKVNTELTKKIFDWYEADPSAKKFIFFSTAKAATERVPEILYEDITPAPVGPYGESKIQAENYILDALEKQGVTKQMMISRNLEAIFPKNGKDVYILRPCIIHGPGNKGNLKLLYKAIRMGIPWPLGAYENRKTFTSIGNVCFAVKGVLDGSIPSGVYNIGDDEPLSTNELVKVVAKVIGTNIHIWHIPPKFINTFAKFGGWLHLSFNPLLIQKLTEDYISSNAKIKEALGITRFPVNAKEGLIFTINSFRNQNN